ncbi:MAG: DUF3261 domain-containing protein [Rhodospirillaceae bacterium]|nr:DUF3261 domain-containing protein [Rhodospirillaceae bacterium]
MMTWTKALAGPITAILLILAGCTPTPVAVTDNLPYFAPGRLLELPLPGDLGRSVEMSQMITVRHDGEVFTFEGHISINPQRFLLVGVDGLGRRAMSISWDMSGKVTAERADWLPSVVRPGPMLADIVLLYWPSRKLRQSLAPSGAVMRDAPNRRVVVVDGVDVLEIDYLSGGDQSTNGRLRYRNHAWGYDIDVRSVEATP